MYVVLPSGRALDVKSLKARTGTNPIKRCWFDPEPRAWYLYPVRFTVYALIVLGSFASSNISQGAIAIYAAHPDNRQTSQKPSIQQQHGTLLRIMTLHRDVP